MIAQNEMTLELEGEEMLVTSAATRDEKIRSLLYLVQHIAGRLVSRLPMHISKDDLVSAGVIGLIDAVDRYDASKGCSLKTFASLRIRGAMVDELRSQDWVPRTVHRDEKIYNEAGDRISQRLGREATPEEIRIELDMDPESFQQFSDRAHVQTYFSLNETWSDEDGNTIDRGDFVPNTKTLTAFEEVVANEDRAMLRKELDRLPQNEKLVLSLYYMEDLRLKEIAKNLNVTESRVSQIHTEAMRRLTNSMKKLRNR